MENEIKWVPEIGVGEDPVEFTLFNQKKTLGERLALLPQRMKAMLELV